MLWWPWFRRRPRGRHAAARGGRPVDAVPVPSVTPTPAPAPPVTPATPVPVAPVTPAPPAASATDPKVALVFDDGSVLALDERDHRVPEFRRLADDLAARSRR